MTWVYAFKLEYECLVRGIHSPWRGDYNSITQKMAEGYTIFHFFPLHFPYAISLIPIPC